MEAGIKDIALASLGRWTWAPLRDVGRTSVVIVGVPTSVAEGEVKATLLRCNADSWGAQLPAPAHIRISRLARRSADPQQPRTPTRSIRLSAPAPFCAFLCRQGLPFLGFSSCQCGSMSCRLGDAFGAARLATTLLHFAAMPLAVSGVGGAT